jgi:hypothetical protein
MFRFFVLLACGAKTERAGEVAAAKKTCRWWASAPLEPKIIVCHVLSYLDSGYTKI